MIANFGNWYCILYEWGLYKTIQNDSFLPQRQTSCLFFTISTLTCLLFFVWEGIASKSSTFPCPLQYIKHSLQNEVMMTNEWNVNPVLRKCEPTPLPYHRQHVDHFRQSMKRQFQSFRVDCFYVWRVGQL